MATIDLESTAKALVTDGKGILAADETPMTLTRRFDALRIGSAPESRRAYRKMFVTPPSVVAMTPSEPGVPVGPQALWICDGMTVGWGQ